MIYNFVETLENQGDRLHWHNKGEHVAGLSLTIKKCHHKNPKGSSIGYFNSSTGIELVLYNGNGPVTMGSNFESIEPVGVARC